MRRGVFLREDSTPDGLCDKMGQRLLVVGISCALGAKAMKQFTKLLSA